jgi:hypothetical protein
VSATPTPTPTPTPTSTATPTSETRLAAPLPHLGKSSPGCGSFAGAGYAYGRSASS